MGKMLGQSYIPAVRMHVLTWDRGHAQLDIIRSELFAFGVTNQLAFLDTSKWQ